LISLFCKEKIEEITSNVETKEERKEKNK